MTGYINKFRGFSCWALAVTMIVPLFLPTMGQAQQFMPYNTRAAFRDAAVDKEFGRIFIAAYDRNEVWAYNPQTLERIETEAVGQAPSGLAISSDGAVLACVNRVDATVSLFRIIGADGAAAFTPYATVSVGDGPASISATPDGRFITANSFADSVSIIDTRGNGSAESVSTAAVPIDAVMGNDSFAVIARSQNAVFLFDSGATKPRKTVSLDTQPVSLEKISDDSYCVASNTKVYLVNATTGAVTATKSIATSDIEVDDGAIFVYSGNDIVQLDGTLAEVQRTSLSNPYLRFVAEHGVMVALNPRDMTLAIANHSGLRYTPEHSAPAPVIVEAATPVDDDGVEEAEVILLDTPEAESGKEAEPVLAELDQNAPAPEDSGTSEAAPESETARASTYRVIPINKGGVSTPKTTRPSADPRQVVTKERILESLLRPTEFASPEAGFQDPDWSQPFRDVTFDSGYQDLSSSSMDLEGNVKLSLGNMNFQSDAFKYDENTGEIFTKGNVNVQQGESTLTADQIFYSLLPENEVPQPLVYEAEYTAEDISKKRLTLGRVAAQNLNVIEPTRIMKADTFEYDLKNGTGSMTHAFGKAGLFYYSAEEMIITGPNSFEAKDFWVTPCECDEDTPPAYRLRLKEVKVVDGEIVSGKNAHLQLRNTNTPLYIPFIGRRFGGLNPMTIDLESGRRAELGFFVNLGQPLQINNDITAGPRFFFSEDEGVGLGADLYYNFMETPSSRLYRTKGEIHTLYTTEERGYAHWYHQYAHSNDLLVKMQVEQWSDEDFFKDFFFDRYRDRTQPRSFANLTWRQPEYIVQATLDVNTHNFVNQRESLPEASFHLLDRKLLDRLYFSFDTINGYYELDQDDLETARTINIARLSLDLEAGEKVNITPFLELEASAFSETRDGDSAGRFSSTIGATLQTRLHKTYPGRLGFSGFKHIILPSLTLSYTPDSTMDFEDNPRLDTWDARDGRTRIETKVDHIFYGKDEESGDVWQVGRLTMYQGIDITSDNAKASDYEIEIDIRPRPWWGFQFVTERHETSDEDLDFGETGFFENAYREFFEDVFDRPLDNDFFEFQFGDYSRILTELYYDNTAQGGRYSGRVGFARTETNDFVFNREVLFGMGYRVNDKWAFSFEHRYDFDDNEFRSQTYELRRSFQCWESSIRFRDRQSGFDVDFAINLKAFPGTKVKF